jgi:hypothetical protein
VPEGILGKELSKRLPSPCKREAGRDFRESFSIGTAGNENRANPQKKKIAFLSKICYE